MLRFSFYVSKNMRKVLFLFLLILTVFSGCSPAEESKSRKVPADILQPEDFAEIVADIQIVESILRDQKRFGQYDDAKAVDLMDEIFDKHGISREKYVESQQFYENNLDLYEQVYEKVITLLTQRQTELTNPAKPDSIR